MQRRTVFVNTAAVVSLAGFIGVLALWLRCGGTHSDEIVLSWQKDYAILSFDSSIYLAIGWKDDWVNRPVNVFWDVGSTWSRGFYAASVIKQFGIECARFGGELHDGKTNHMYPNFRAVQMPHWFLLLVFWLLPARQAWQWRHRKHRILNGLCPTCGYDLRASPDRCPECGTAIEKTGGTAETRRSQKEI